MPKESIANVPRATSGGDLKVSGHFSLLRFRSNNLL
jgi:hypothetical protein